MKEEDLKILFSGIYESILDAQKEVEETFVKNVFNTYFDDLGKPKTIQIDLAGKKTDVPYFTLVPHNNLKISEVNFEMEIKLDTNNSGFLNKVLNSNKNNAKLNIKFSEIDKTEAIARINNLLINL